MYVFFKGRESRKRWSIRRRKKQRPSTYGSYISFTFFSLRLLCHSYYFLFGFFSFSLGRQHPELFFNGIHSKKKNSKPKEKEENKKYSYVHNIYLYIFSVVILHR